MTKKIIRPKEIKSLKKIDEPKHDLGWLSCGSKIKVSEAGTTTIFLCGEVVEINEQKNAAISIPKTIVIKVTRCETENDLENTLVELEFREAKKGKKPMFKINRIPHKICHNCFVIDHLAA